MSKLLTYTGQTVDLQNLDLAHIRIDDIARALSMICRYGGHVRYHYSVAQHSVLVSLLAQEHGPTAAFLGLLHDAAEAYYGDVIRPLRKLLPAYDTMEETALEDILLRFGLDQVGQRIWEVVIDADNEALMLERDYVLSHPERFPLRDRARTEYRKHVREMSPGQAENFFLQRFFDLRGSFSASPVVAVGSDPLVG